MAPLICCTGETFKKSLQKLSFHLVYLFIFRLHVSVYAKHQQSIQDLDDNKCNVNYMLIVTHFLIALYMQSTNKAKQRLFAKHTVPKEAQRSPQEARKVFWQHSPSS